ncbi:PREDICTED: 30 kDa salivary gland allergen Aed a 3-like [Camelina sativa]|uniref:30 kDa salivary gland allergen Aed a 3-like n=1 Tax=Camelina sativa TaxID=90675 RepID=A0ABM0XHE7_CAMSA|nr:PREDICTED: 30 kDa salivary gland allergen Aed a 3-like [Camelina sativa]XP_010486038.1 PREDICTED: 30 kDa salivary gland allergen Aed a 3-like [Camelina sativa]
MDLKENVAETTTQGDSSKLMEAREPMEESSPVASASLTKRKAESDQVEQSGGEAQESGDGNEESGDEAEESGDEDEGSGDEDEESGDGDEESGDEAEESGDGDEESGDGDEESGDEDDYVDPDEELLHPTWWKVPEWDVDSFDGLEYDSSEYKDEFPDEEDEKEWRRFKRQLIENKGFYVDPELWSMYNYSDYKVVPNLDLDAGFDQTYGEYFAEMACLCLKKYNKDKGSNVEFVEVVRGIFTAGSRSKSYITFMAKEKPDGPLVEYQAKVWSTVIQNENYPILCRPAPTAKPSNQK